MEHTNLARRYGRQSLGMVAVTAPHPGWRTTEARLLEALAEVYPCDGEFFECGIDAVTNALAAL